MSNPRTSTSSHRSSSSVKYAAGVATPFPTGTNAKFEYPVNSASKVPSSPIRSSARDRHEFAASLQRALRNLKGPFTSNKTPKMPPSILERKRVATSGSDSLFSSVRVSTLCYVGIDLGKLKLSRALMYPQRILLWLTFIAQARMSIV